MRKPISAYTLQQRLALGAYDMPSRNNPYPRARYHLRRVMPLLAYGLAGAIGILALATLLLAIICPYTGFNGLLG